MVWYNYLVFLGVIVEFIGAYSYIKQIYLGKAKPNRVSWLMWSIAPMIAFFAAISAGVTWAVVPVFMSGFIPLLVLIVSFHNKKSYWDLGKFDYVCGFFSLVALILWYVTKNPSIAILFAIFSDGSAALPTVIKSWKHPHTEHSSTYIAGIFSVSLGFFAMNQWNFSELAFPIYLIVICAIILYAINRKKIFKK